MSSSSNEEELNTPMIRLIDYLDDKLGKWWEQPESTNALLMDRTYHLTHLELVRVGTLSVTEETATSAYIKYKNSVISLFDYYRDKLDIELQHPEMPLFTCDDGDNTMYPAEVIIMEIVRSTLPRTTSFVGKQVKSTPLITFLENRVGENWPLEVQLVKHHLKNIQFYLSHISEPFIGNLALSSKQACEMMSFEEGDMLFSEWFEKIHGHEIENPSLPLISVKRITRKKLRWPAELISVVLN